MLRAPACSLKVMPDGEHASMFDASYNRGLAASHVVKLLG